MTPPNVVWPEAYCFCPVRVCIHASMCASRNINVISCRVFDTFSPNLHQQCVLGQVNASQFGIKRSRSRWNKVCWKQHFLGLLTRCLEKYLSDFLQTYTSDGTEVNVLNFGIKRSKFKVTVEYTRMVTAQAEAYSTRYSTSRVELDLLVS